MRRGGGGEHGILDHEPSSRDCGFLGSAISFRSVFQFGEAAVDTASPTDAGDPSRASCPQPSRQEAMPTPHPLAGTLNKSLCSVRKQTPCCGWRECCLRMRDNPRQRSRVRGSEPQLFKPLGYRRSHKITAKQYHFVSSTTSWCARQRHKPWQHIVMGSSETNECVNSNKTRAR